MCELLVRVVDKINPTSPELNAQCMKRGDVVSVCPDGWAWSAKEQAGDPWYILKFPGDPSEDALPYFEGPAGDPPDPMAPIRTNFFNLNAPAVFNEASPPAPMLSYLVVK